MNVIMNHKDCEAKVFLWGFCLRSMCAEFMSVHTAAEDFTCACV